MNREPDIGALRALALVAEENSISSAGATLGVSQQAVSMRIRGLEKDLRVRLLVRSARGSRLTPAGELVVEWARPVLAAVDEFTGAAESLRTDRIRTMRIAASLTIAEHLLPEWIARWRTWLGEDGPVVHLAAANSTAVVNAVRAGTADLGFVESPAPPTDLGSVVVGSDRIDVVVHRGHRWAQTGTVGARELARTALVLREPGSGTRQVLERALEEAGTPLTAEPAEVLATTLGIRSAVMAGVAPGALSSLAVGEDVRAGRLVRVRVRSLRMRRPLTAVWAGAAPSGSAQDLLRVIAERSR